MTASAEHAAAAASRSEYAAAQSERAADRADTRARDADRISRWIVGLMVALFLAMLLQGFETRLALSSMRIELQNEIGAVRIELQNEIGAVRAEFQNEIGAVRAELTALSEMQTEIVAAVTDLVAVLAESDSPRDRPAPPPR